MQHTFRSTLTGGYSDFFFFRFFFFTTTLTSSTFGGGIAAIISVSLSSFRFVKNCSSAALLTARLSSSMSRPTWPRIASRADRSSAAWNLGDRTHMCAARPACEDVSLPHDMPLARDCAVRGGVSSARLPSAPGGVVSRYVSDHTFFASFLRKLRMWRAVASDCSCLLSFTTCFCQRRFWHHA